VSMPSVVGGRPYPSGKSGRSRRWPSMVSVMVRMLGGGTDRSGRGEPGVVARGDAIADLAPDRTLRAPPRCARRRPTGPCRARPEVGRTAQSATRRCQPE
jgi:hypothetical protein